MEYREMHGEPGKCAEVIPMQSLEELGTGEESEMLLVSDAIEGLLPHFPQTWNALCCFVGSSTALLVATAYDDLRSNTSARPVLCPVLQ